MKKGALLFLFVALAFVMLSAPSFADSVDKAADAMQEGQDMMDKGQGAMDKGQDMMDIKDAEVMEATVTCVQVDQGGTLTGLTEFKVCTGTRTADKSAAVVAPKAQSAVMKGGKQTVAGELAGHARGYILASASALDDKGATETVKGL